MFAKPDWKKIKNWKKNQQQKSLGLCGHTCVSGFKARIELLPRAHAASLPGADGSMVYSCSQNHEKYIIILLNICLYNKIYKGAIVRLF